MMKDRFFGCGGEHFEGLGEHQTDGLRIPLVGDRAGPVPGGVRRVQVLPLIHVPDILALLEEDLQDRRVVQIVDLGLGGRTRSEPWAESMVSGFWVFRVRLTID